MSIREIDGEILALGRERVPARTIAVRLDCDRRRVRSLLLANGVVPCTLSEARKTHSGPNKGRNFSAAYREKLAKAKRGKKQSPEMIANRSAAARLSPNVRRGPAHFMWKGGVTKESKKQRNTPEYKAWRAVVYKRDDFTCLLCSARGGELHADHIKPWSRFPALRFDVSNGRTLCVPCHRKTPTWGVNLARTP